MPRERRKRRDDDPARDPAWLHDMLTASREVQSFVAGRTFQQYFLDSMFRSAVERQVEIIGEAARRLTEGFRAAHPEIPWDPIMAQRHRLAHEYDKIKNELIWDVATIHVPRLIEQIEPLIPPAPPEIGEREE